MMALLAAVILGGAFGSASATVVSMEPDAMVIDLQVEVIGASGSETVIAHLFFENEPEGTLPLLGREDGVFGIETQMKPKNYVVVFEIVGEEPETSDPISLTQMGADLGPVSAPTTAPSKSEDQGLSTESQQFLWLAIALGAAALSVIAFWVLWGGRAEDPGEQAPFGADEEE